MPSWDFTLRVGLRASGAERIVYTRAFYPAYDSNLICLAIWKKKSSKDQTIMINGVLAIHYGHQTDYE